MYCEIKLIFFFGHFFVFYALFSKFWCYYVLGGGCQYRKLIRLFLLLIERISFEVGIPFGLVNLGKIVTRLCGFSMKRFLFSVTFCILLLRFLKSLEFQEALLFLLLTFR